MIRDLLSSHGPELLAGTSVLLALGVLLSAASKRPLAAQRRAELSLLAVWLFVPLALIPLTRPTRALLEKLSPAPTESLTTPAAPLAVGVPVAHLIERVMSTGQPLPTTTRAPIETSGVELLSPGALPSQLTPRSDPSTLAADDSRSERLTDLATLEGRRSPSLGQTLAGSVDTQPLPTRTSIGEVLVTMFLIGALVCAVRLLTGVLRLRRLLGQAAPAPAWIHAWLDENARDLDVRVVLVRDARSPFCVGLRRQTIVLPPAMLHGGRDAALIPVLRHELAHASQRDGLGRLLCALSMPLLWFHPLYWWLRARIHTCSELLADDRAADDNRPAYARQLLELAERLPRPDALPAGARSVFGRRNEFTRRIEMLLQRKERLDTDLGRANRSVHSLLALATLAICVSLFGARPLQAQDAAALAEIESLRAQNAHLQNELAELKAALNGLMAEREMASKKVAEAEKRRELEQIMLEAQAKLALEQALADQARAQADQDALVTLHEEMRAQVAEANASLNAQQSRADQELARFSAEIAEAARADAALEAAQHALQQLTSKREYASAKSEIQKLAKESELAVAKLQEVAQRQHAEASHGFKNPHAKGTVTGFLKPPAKQAPHAPVTVSGVAIPPTSHAPHVATVTGVPMPSAPHAPATVTGVAIPPAPHAQHAETVAGERNFFAAPRYVATVTGVPLVDGSQTSAPRTDVLAPEASGSLSNLPTLELGRQLLQLRSERDRTFVDLERMAKLHKQALVSSADLHTLESKAELLVSEIGYLELLGEQELLSTKRSLGTTLELLASWVVPEGAEGNEARLQKMEIEREITRLETQLLLLREMF